MNLGYIISREIVCVCMACMQYMCAFLYGYLVENYTTEFRHHMSHAKANKKRHGMNLSMSKMLCLEPSNFGITVN